MNPSSDSSSSGSSADDDDSPVVDDDGDYIICHKPGTPAERTMHINPSAWDGHEGHGDSHSP